MLVELGMDQKEEMKGSRGEEEEECGREGERLRIGGEKWGRRTQCIWWLALGYRLGCHILPTTQLLTTINYHPLPFAMSISCLSLSDHQVPLPQHHPTPLFSFAIAVRSCPETFTIVTWNNTSSGELRMKKWPNEKKNNSPKFYSYN